MNRLPRKSKFKIVLLRGFGIAAPHVVTHLLEGFEDIGNEVRVFDVYELFNKDTTKTLFEKYSLMIGFLDEFKPDFGLMYAFNGLIPITLPPEIPVEFTYPKELYSNMGGETHVLAALKIPYLMFHGDDPFIVPDQLLAVREAPRQWMSVWDGWYLPHLIENGFERVFELPLGTSPRHFFHVPVEDVPEKFRCEVSFVGSPSPDRIPFLERIAERADLAIFGWEDWKKHPSLVHLWRGPAGYPEEANLIYNGSKITLEILKEQVKSTFTQRQFDALAGGNFVLCEYRPGLERFLEPDKEFISFKTTDEAVNLIDALLKDPDRIRAVSEAGKDRVLREHTWACRARTALDFMTGASW